MGNTLDGPACPERYLELQLPAPFVEAPLGQGGKPSTLFAQVGPLEDRSAIRNTAWNQPVQVCLAQGCSSVLVSIFATDQSAASSADAGPNEGEARFIGEVCLPYEGLVNHGLRPGGEQFCLRLAFVPGARCCQSTPDQLAVAFHKARKHYHQGTPHVVIWVREREKRKEDGQDLDFTLNPLSSGTGRRETRDVVRPSPFQESVPKRMQALKLELETITLDVQRQKLSGGRTGPEPDAEPDSLPTTPVKDSPQPWAPANSLIKNLGRIEGENSQLLSEMDACLQRLEASIGARVVAPRTTEMQREQWRQQQRQLLQHRKKLHGGGDASLGGTLRVLELELEKFKDRRRKIEESYKDRIGTLQQSLFQARTAADKAEEAAENAFASAPPSPSPSRGMAASPRRGRSPGPSIDLAKGVATGAARLKEAMAKLDSLEISLRNMTEVQDDLLTSMSPEFQRLTEQGHKYKAELARLQQELAGLHERERGEGVGVSEPMLREQVQHVYDEMELYNIEREDEKVRSESELRELRCDRDNLTERVGDTRLELKRLCAQVVALREYSGDGTPSPQMSSVEDEAQIRELEALERREVEQRHLVADLEREQDQLVEQMSKISLQAASGQARPAMAGAASLEQYEAKAEDLGRQLATLQFKNQARRDEITRANIEVQVVQGQTESLRRLYDEQRRTQDARVLLLPEGSASIPSTS